MQKVDLTRTSLLATIPRELKMPIASMGMSARLLIDERIGEMNVGSRYGGRHR